MNHNDITDVSNYSDQEIGSIYKIIEVIDHALINRRSEKKLFIPLSYFPKELSKFEIIKTLEKMERELHALGFLGFVNGENEEVADIYFEEKHYYKIRKIVIDRFNNVRFTKNEIPVAMENKIPFLQVDNGIGYLNLSGEKIEIGKAETGKYRLLQSLFEPTFGTAKTPEAVFESIKSERHSSKSDFSDQYLARNKKADLIKMQFKEIQRIIAEHRRTKAREDLRLKMKMDARKIWLEQ